MWDNVIGQHIRRTNRNLLLTNAVLVVLVLGVAVLARRYLLNFAFGPVDVTPETLQTTTSPDQLAYYFVRVNGDHAQPTGIQEIEQKGNQKTVRADYVALEVGPKILIVKTTDKDQGPRVVGELKAMPTDVRTQVVGKIEARQPELRGVFLPCMLDATGFRGPGYWGVAIGGPILLFAVWWLARIVWRRADPFQHPAARALLRYGIPDEVAAVIDADLNGDGPVLRHGNFTLGSNWLLNASIFTLDVLHLREVVWIFKKVTRHSTNGIPTGKTFAAVLATVHGRQLEIPGKDKQTDEILHEVHARIPWVLAGFGPELEKAWKSDVAGMAAAVEERRQQFLQMVQAEAQARPAPGGGDETGRRTE